MPRPPVINVMDRAVRRAGRGLVRDFGEVEQLQASRRGPGAFVAAAVRRAAAVLREELARGRPGFGFAGADSDRGGDRWIVAPLSGAANFLHGIPHFAVSVAAADDRGLAAGVVYAPLVDELYQAARGEGAFVRNRRLRVSARRDPGEALIAAGPAGSGDGGLPAALQGMAGRVAEIRRFGAVALDLAWVAAGRCDGCWAPGAAPAEMAAGLVLVREAGGLVTDPAGGGAMMRTGGVVAANDLVHAPLLALARAPADPPPKVDAAARPP